MRLLLEHDAGSEVERSLLRAVYRERSPEVLRLLAELGARREVGPVDELIGLCFAGDREGALRIAAEHPERVERIRGESYEALHQAASEGRPVAAELLLELGVPIDLPGQRGGTPLHHAAWWGHGDVVALLLEHGADPQRRAEPSGDTPLAWTAHGSFHSPGPVAGGGTDHQRIAEFMIDGQGLGADDTDPPFSTEWDTRTATAGPHTITAEATDAAGNVGASEGVAVNVNNTAPPPAVLSIDKQVNVRARSTLTATGMTTAAAGEQLVAFVAMDGPNGAAGQRATVTGAGLTWTLVKRSDSQAGVSEIWTAKATGALTNASITATPLRSGNDGLLDVIAFKNAAGVGVAGASGAPSGAPDIYLPGVATGSWVFAVGNDWDRAVARTPTAGQVLQQQWIDTAVGDTFWVQSTAAPQSTAPGLVTIHDTAPTNDRWNYAAVEVTAKPAGS